MERRGTEKNYNKTLYSMLCKRTPGKDKPAFLRYNNRVECVCLQHSKQYSMRRELLLQKNSGIL